MQDTMTQVAGDVEHASGASLWADPGATVATDPDTGLVFVDLSHPWGTHTPVYPGYPDIRIHRSVTHASHGVMSQHIRAVMHNGTHVNAPIHLVQRGAGVGDLDLERFFGSGVVLPVAKERWELVEADDLEACPLEVFADDIVIICTGWHRRYSDSQEYFGEAPGLSASAAEWLIERRVKLVGVDTATIDHPMATSLGRHRNGPIIHGLPERYELVTGRRPEDDFPEWNPAHRALLGAGVPTVENVGGGLGLVSGRRCTFQAFPWGWPKGDACVVRLTAIFDPSGAYRLGAGA
jgi:kynurenine formamidase